MNLTADAAGVAAPDGSHTHPQPPLRVLVLTMPAHGHYMTIKGIAVGLARAGHAVTFALCEQSRATFDADGLAATHGIGFLSAGGCPTYNSREAALRDLIAHPGDVGAIGRMLDGVAQLGAEMCDHLLPHFLAAPPAALPDVIVFDADSYCGLDLGHALRVPAVARVGTGLRDAHTTPLTVPLYGSGAQPPASLPQRLASAALLAVSRHAITPALIPRVYSRHRARLVAAADAHFSAAGVPPPLALPGVAAHPAAAADFLAARASSMRPDLLWDGQPALYNTHWGLEHPRPTLPFEHVIGHTTDFDADAARPLPAHVGAFLDVAHAHGARVVYVSLGTLSVLPQRWLASLADAVCAAVAPPAGGGVGDVRAVWVVPAAQQGGVPGCPHRTADGHPRVLLTDWLPQAAALRHPAVGVFVTHGGMNSVGEGTFARTPMLCVPLFSDQPDNCARIAWRGMGVAVDPQLRAGELDKGEFVDAVAGLLRRGEEHRGALQRAWDANLAAGGVPRAVGIIEAAARGGYGGHLAAIPAAFYQPWYRAGGLDVAVAAVALAALVRVLLARLCCCRRGSRAGGGKAKAA